jgi:multimeric flavodoxin WrbA
MRVVGIVGSPRPNGNTERAVREALDSVAKDGIEIELVRLAGLAIAPCDGCAACRQSGECHIQDDFIGVYEKMTAAHGIVIGSPVYFSGPNAAVMALIQRAGYVAQATGRPFERKVGAPITVARRAGHNFALAQLLFFFLHQGMIVPGSSYWSIAFGREPGEVETDQEGMLTLRNLGANLAWTLRRLHAQ